MLNWIWKKSWSKAAHILKIEAQIPNKTGLIVLAIKTIEDNKMIFNPPVNYTFRIGDVLIVLGREDQVDKLKHLGDETK